MKVEALTRWTVDDSAELYGIRNWGAGYFDISEKGEVVVLPKGKGSGTAISLMDIVSGLNARGMTMPVLLRFGDILASRVALLNNSFQKAPYESITTRLLKA